MTNADSLPGEEPYPSIHPLLQKIYKLAKDGHVPGLKIGQSYGEYVCDQHESIGVDGLHEKIIIPYNQNVVFEELADMLAARDTHEKLYHAATGGVAPEDMDSRFELANAIFDDYIEEFEEHGVGRVVVDKTRVIPCEQAHD